MGRFSKVGLVALALLVTMSCSARENQADDPSETAEATASAAASPGESSAAGAVSDLDGVEQATIQIVAEGSFVDPEVGLTLNAAGSGSGFLISADGLAVTNNHVVTGAALLDVYVGGSDEPVNARVLGVSECSDLAVIDLEGGDYPFLEFYEGEVSTGLDVFAAGYPLGNPEFTLTRGIVSKADADGETNWASVDGVLQHDATINPGNSGGPLIDENGQVVAVNYAADDSATQYFAIGRDETQAVVEQLSEGEDVESIGINGVALSGEDEVSGIWVSSVATGSPADGARIRPGDIVTRMEGLVLATDGTMSEYCDILRSNDPEDTLSVEVLRFETDEYFEGQLNGRELELAFSFAEELEEEASAGGGDPAATYSGYTTITDDTGAISVDVPSEWSDVDGAPYTPDDGIQRFDVRASSDLAAFQGGWDTPGMIFTASSALAQVADENVILDELVESGSSQCTYEGRQPYQDAAYTGQFDTYTNCGGVGATYVVVGAVPQDRSFIMRVQIQANSERDFEALDRILRSFVVVGQV